jgi:hypothetical protein
MTPTRPALSPLRRGVAAVVAAVVLMAITAGCGGSSPSSSSTNSASAANSQSPGGPARRFSACMRSHGLANFPDPVVHVSGNSASVGIKITPALANSPRFKAAQAACNHILPSPTDNGPSPPQQQVRTRAMVAFAQCLRTHGFPRFPDPNAHGELSLEMVNAAGIDLHTPALLTAAKGCTSVTHGQITPAQVVRAINGPH